MIEAESDGELLRRWSDGDRTAGNALVTRHFAEVYRFVRRRLDDPVAAKDIAQRTFLVCVERKAEVARDVRFGAWAIGIARNLLLHLHRDAGRRRTHDAVPTPSRSVTTPSGVLVSAQERALLGAAMSTLSEDLLAVVQLHYWEELPTREIAVILGIAPGTVKWRLSTARAALRKAIEQGCTAVIDRETTLRRLEAIVSALGHREGTEGDP